MRFRTYGFGRFVTRNTNIKPAQSRQPHVKHDSSLDLIEKIMAGNDLVYELTEIDRSAVKYEPSPP